MYGAAIATVISEGIVTITQLIFVRKDLKLRLIFPKEIIKRFFSSAIMLVWISVAKKFMGGTAFIIQIVLCVCIGVGTYSASEILLGDELMKDLLMLIKNRIVRRSKV